MQGSLLSSVGKILWRLLEAHKIDPDALFRQSGLDPELLQEPRIRYPFESVIDAWVEASRATGNSSIGLEAAKFYTPLDMHALGVSFLSSSTLLEALHRLDRYESVLNSSLDFTIVEQEGRIDFLSDAKIDSKEGARVAEDARQSVVLDLCRLGLDKSLNPVAVGFTYPEPKSTGEHFAIFRCPLEFSQPIARISFSAEDAQRRFTASNRELAISNDQILDGMIKELKSSGLVSQVKRAIIDDLPSGTPSESDIAKHVFVSSRTLQRKLAEEGTSFRELLLEVRRELAEQYISDQHMPLAEISYMLGFADQSSFFRAFKKWTGESPAKFRNNLG
jgi:AraC-like DNA-binding protein